MAEIKGITRSHKPFTIQETTEDESNNLLELKNKDGEVVYTVSKTGVASNDPVAGGAAPSNADYLVGTTQGSLSAEIVVGATPGGELGGTWASPTVDASHSGSTHAAVQSAAESTAASALSTHSAAADPHTVYQKESEKGATNGYAGLGANTLVPVAQLGTGTPTGAKFLRDDQTYAVPGAGSTTTEVNVADHGAVGDGVTNDAAAIAAAITAAGGTKIVTAFPGKTFLVLTQVVIATAGARLDFNGSTIKKGANIDTVSVTGANVVVQNLVVDGNKAGGFTGEGMLWTGTGGIARNLIVQNAKASGLVLDGSGTLDCHFCEFNTNGDGVTLGSGVKSNSGTARLRLYGPCKATDNYYAGVFIGLSADKAHVDVITSLNAFGVRIQYANNGTSSYIRCDEDDQFGVMMLNYGTEGQWGFGWKFDYVECSRLGVPAGLATGTGMELYGIHRCHVGTLITNACNGYGLALTGGETNPTTAASKYNVFGTVICDGQGATDSDPAVHLSRGSKWNRFGFISVRKYTIGVRLGEDYNNDPFTNDNNTFGIVAIEDCAYSGITIEGGSHNYFGQVHLTHVGTVEGSCGKSPGAISFKPYHSAGCAPAGASNIAMGPVNNNIFGLVKYHNPSADGFIRAQYVVAVDETIGGPVSNNRIINGYYNSATDYRTAIKNPATDINGNNFNMAAT